MNTKGRASFSLAEKTGICVLISASLLFFIHPYLAVIPLSGFLVVCFTAPFLPKFGFFLPIICRGKPGTNNIALTFDDGPSPLSTPIVLELLAYHNLVATFFVVGEKIEESPELIKKIIAQGHTIGNHSWSHDYFLMLRGRKRLQHDIQKTQEELRKKGVQAWYFRPPTGITGPRLAEALNREGLVTLTYSCRAFDRGNRNINNLGQKILNRLQPGDIIMLHDLPPYNLELLEQWRQELDVLFAALSMNYKVVPLEQMIQNQTTGYHS